MIKVFNKEKETFSEKVNFVDDRNVLVGYDTAQQCCENAGWFISEDIEQFSYKKDYEKYKVPILETYIFDTDFFQRHAGGDLNEGEMVIFKLISTINTDLYLHIFNSHNGCYGHGFKFEEGNEILKEGTL